MHVKIPYRKNQYKIEIPDPVEIFHPFSVTVRDTQEMIKDALASPLGRSSYNDFINTSDRVLVIVNDATKPTPTSTILDYLSSSLVDHPDVTFLVATGTHRDPSEDELRYIFGKQYSTFKNKIFTNNAKATENFTDIGTTKRGTRVFVNNMILDAKNILVLGSVEPHYFAGYTGGRKAIIPGVSSYETVECNHRWAMNSNAHSLALEGNPVHEDMMEASTFLEKINIFSIQTVLTPNQKIYAVTAGDLHNSFFAAVDHAKKIYGVPLTEKADIVISVVPHPMDINLYQSQHALENGSLALKEGGVIILVSACRKGVGNDSFLKLLNKADDHEGIMKIIGDNYTLGDHKAARISKLGSWAHMWAVTDLDDEIIQKSHMKPYKDIQSAVDDAVELVKKKGKQTRTIVIPSGSHTVPLL